MTDVRTVLQAAAAAPSGPLDVTVLHRLAAQPAWRRRLAVVAGGLALLGASLAPSWGGLTPASGGHRVHTEEGRPPAVVEVDTKRPHEVGTLERAGRAGAAEDAPVGAAEQSVSRPDGGQNVPAVVTTTTLAHGASLDAEGCRTEPGTGWSTEYGGFGWDAMYDLECRYSATRPGGYRAAGVWRITILRAGRTILYESTTSPSCAAIGTIQPGDEVTATVRTGGVSSDGWFVEVGDQARC